MPDENKEKPEPHTYQIFPSIHNELKKLTIDDKEFTLSDHVNFAIRQYLDTIKNWK